MKLPKSCICFKLNINKEIKENHVCWLNHQNIYWEPLDIEIVDLYSYISLNWINTRGNLFWYLFVYGYLMLWPLLQWAHIQIVIDYFILFLLIQWLFCNVFRGSKKVIWQWSTIIYCKVVMIYQAGYHAIRLLSHKLAYSLIKLFISDPFLETKRNFGSKLID